MAGSKALLNELSDAVVSGNVHKARKLAERIIDEGFSAIAAFDKMTEAMKIVDKKYERKEYAPMMLQRLQLPCEKQSKCWNPT